MKKLIEFSIHLFFWISFTAFAFILSKIYLQVKPDAPFSNHLFYTIFLELFMGLIFFYSIFFGLKWAKKKKTNLTILSILILFLLLFFAYPATRFGIWEIMSSIIPHIIIIFLAIIFRRFSDYLTLEKEKQDLELQNVRSELFLLKTQLSPHFLFNTLNNIDYLVNSNTQKASDSISKLGTILRYMLYDAEVDKIELSKEIDYIENYIQLIRMRIVNDNYIKLQISGNYDNLKIAPMLFIPLIENACKYSINKVSDDVIKINIIVREKKLTFTIENIYDEKNSKYQASGGLGLKIVKRRLELIYKNKHILNITKQNNQFKIDVTIELDEY